MIPILWLDWWDGHNPGAMWDQHQIKGLFAADRGVVVNHHLAERAAPADMRSAVVVVPGRFAAGDEPAVQTLIDGLERVLVVVTSDEESDFQYEQLEHPDMRLWVQTPKLGRGPADRFLGCGPTPHADILADRPADGIRPYRWVFDGQINNPRRFAMKAATAAFEGDLSRDNNLWTATSGFTKGHTTGVYLDRLASAQVALCPAGPFTPDTFRLWEALEAGTLPLAGAYAPGGEPGYWNLLFDGDPPFPILHDPESLHGHLVEALDNWHELNNRAQAGWLAYKQRLRWTVADTFTWLDGLDRTGTITVLVPTSPIASHPDTAIIEETVDGVRERLPDADIVLMVDGLRLNQEHRAEAYAEYTRRVLHLANHRWRNVYPIVADEWLHQVHLTMLALDVVRTPTILFVEHDTPLDQEIPFDDLVKPVLEGDADVIRLHHETEILAVHRYLMLDREPQIVHGVPMTRTRQWSQRPHLASTAYYRERVSQVAGPKARCFIEDVIIGIIDRGFTSDQKHGWFRNRLWIYTPEGNIRRSWHIDARGEDPKGEQCFDYPDGRCPAGAPHARWIPGG